MKAKKLLSASLTLMLLAGVPWCSVSAENVVTTPVIVHSGESETINTNVIVQDEESAVKVEAQGNGEDKNAFVKINGDAELLAPNKLATAVTAAASTGNASAEITGNVKAQSELHACGVSLNEESSEDALGKANVKVGGNISAEGEFVVGLDANSGKADVDGYVIAQGTHATGVQSYNLGDNTVINVNKGIAVAGKDNATGATLETYHRDNGTNLTLNVLENIVAALIGTGHDNKTRGISVNNNGGNILADIGGDVLAKSNMEDTVGIENGAQLEDLEYAPMGKTTILIHGNLLSGGVGIYNRLNGNITPTDILVENEIQANKVGVLINREPTLVLDGNPITPSAPKLNLTVWKIKPNEQGNVAEYSINPWHYPDGIPPQGTVLEGKDQEFEKKIMYIIKVKQPTQGGIINVVDKDGNELLKSFGFDVAHEGEKVLLKADLEKGYKLVSAYNENDEKVPLLKDENGNYYIIVPKGGGIYLGAELETVSDNFYNDFNGNENNKSDSRSNLKDKDLSLFKYNNEETILNLKPVQTGDDIQVTSLLLLLAVSAVGIIILGNRRKEYKTI